MNATRYTTILTVPDDGSPLTTVTTFERVQIGEETPPSAPEQADAPTCESNNGVNAVIVAPLLAAGATSRVRMEKSVDGGELYDATSEWDSGDVSPGRTLNQGAGHPHAFIWRVVDANDIGDTTGHELTVEMSGEET